MREPMSTAEQRATDRLERARGELEALSGPYLSVGRALRLGALILALAVALGGLWTFGTTVVLESDPLFGGHAESTCADVCDGCRGPYVFEETTTIQGSAAVTDALGCRDEAGVVHAVPGGLWYVAATVIGAVLPLALVIVFVLAVVGRRRYLARRASWQSTVEDAERQLAELSG